MDNQLPAKQQQLTPCLTVQKSLSERLKPVSAKEGETELLACLVLVAPSGMTADDRHAWIKVARETLKGIPADLLKSGCRRARETCRFASEIVPTILAAVGSEWKQRQRWYAEDSAPRLAPPKPEAIPREVTQRILKQVREEMLRERGEA